MDEQTEFVRWIAERLDTAQIPYMITGSVAMSFYATPRMTRDLDLVVEMDSGDLPGLLRAFENDCYIEPNAVKDAVRSSGMFNIIHNTWVMKADFIVRKNEPYRIREFERRQRIKLEDAPVWVVAIEDLILSKLVWVKDSESELQLRDVRQLVTAKSHSLDWEYMRKWATSLGVLDILESVTNG